MSSLQQLQAEFQDYLLGDNPSALAIQTLVQDNHGLSAGARLGIYHRAYRVRLHDALSDGFEKSHIYLGDELFQQMAMAFIARHPSHFRNLRWYGGEFPYFLRQELSELPQVTELAQFEWALGLAFDASDTPVLQTQELAHLQERDWGEISFELVSSVQFLSLQTNAPAIWLALSQDEMPPDAQEQPQTWMIWRKNLQAHFRSLSAAEHQALLGLQNAEAFSAVCERTAATYPETSQHIGNWLHSWLQDGLFSAYSIGQSDQV